MEINDINTWCFGTDNDALIALVLSGNKRATTSLLSDYKENEPLPKVGDLGILVFDNKKKACITRVTKVTIIKFKDITEDLAYIEGEGNKTFSYYRTEHIRIFKNIDLNFSDESKVVFEEFEVVENLVETRLN